MCRIALDRCLGLSSGVPVCFDQVDLGQSYGQKLIGGGVRFIACRLLNLISISQQVVHIDMEDLGQGLDHLELGLRFPFSYWEMVILFNPARSATSCWDQPRSNLKDFTI